MPTIGHLKMHHDRVLRGFIQSSRRSVNIQLTPIPEGERRDANSPYYRVEGINHTGEVYELGGGWVKRMQEGTTEREYLSLSMDDPDWTGPLSCAAFPTKGKPNEYDVVWNRPDRSQQRAA
ncbi:DUF736 family protein [Ferrovibrio sp.]|uniref:DUF736 family protein n=1 Tax=Ferrovibrio sp. TaxID=1917215 RepID=UPI0025B83DA3|nr:DUF736 family protein [Ferrovibrio sp.]MBX3456589.1 DUF736 family protein [Ferrovibrio sp.]